ncbi:MAG: c-type cytochrome biogenesis protein CcmI [Thiobacillus sp.]
MNPFWTVSLFWIGAVVCVVIALAFVLPALLRSKAAAGKADRREINIAVYRDQMKELEADRVNGLVSEEQFQTAKLELEGRLADDALTLDTTPEPGRVGSRKLGYTLAAIIPVAAFGLYFVMGNPESLMAIADTQTGPTQAAMGNAPDDHDFMQMIQQVEEKTRTNPDDGEAWGMLAKTYGAMEQWPQALQAYEKAVKLLPGLPSLMTGYAEALAITNNRVLKGRPMELVLTALEADPDDIKGLELAGINAFQEENFAQAGYYFKRLHKLLPPESPYAQDILEARKEAERLAHAAATGLDNLANPPPAADSKSAAVEGARIVGSVDIAPALKSKLSSNDTVFLFARPGTSGAPVAAVRSTAGKLPLEFSLNDSMAMNPGNVLSQHKEVVLVARVSKSGNPIGQTGDLEGRISSVKVGATGVKLVIDQVLP